MSRERSVSGDTSDWPVRLAAMVGAGTGAAIVLLWRPEFFKGFLPGFFGFVLFVVVGGVIGRLLGGRLFGASSGGPGQPPAT